jgi:outer membrane protein insertion porin family
MGNQTDDPVGGDFLFLAGLEYNVPIYQDVLRGVVFIDSGTVQERLELSDYRVSIGTGIRLKVPFLGTAPFAFDFAIPLAAQDDDEKRIFSFDIAIPF